MDPGLVVAVGLAYAFAFTNGVQDAANAIATLVATRAGRPAPALVASALAALAGPMLLGAGVAGTIAGLIHVDDAEAAEVVSAGLLAALAWNLAAWSRGLPSSSSHALVGGLAGAAATAAGLDAVNWGELDGWRPGGVAAVLVALAVSPLLGAAASALLLRFLRRALARATRRMLGPVRAGQWGSSLVLAVAQGANDAQKAVGVVAIVLVAEGVTESERAPLWATAGAALALAAGTAVGGWGIVRTIGRRIYELRPLDGLANQTASAAVVLGASLVGAPVSTTHTVASSVVGAGLGRERWGRIRWAVVRELGLAWLTTLPATALLGAVLLSLWRWLE
ncbi:MAG TPA: inorganic phosphate transporter [Gaiellaceae bacterium]|nr:inorganic phosphate transporter [Gaiellaceae bacterium]